MAQDIDTIITQLIRIAKYISHQPTTTFEERASTLLQYHALSYLEKNTEANLTDVAKHLNASLSSMTQLIERMHKLGLVTRANDEKDRRVTRLSVTGEGLDKLKNMKEAKKERMKKLLANIAKTDIKELIRIQEQMINNTQVK